MLYMVYSICDKQYLCIDRQTEKPARLMYMEKKLEGFLLSGWIFKDSAASGIRCELQPISCSFLLGN